MKLSSLVVMYLWTNIYTVNSLFLRKPFLSIHQQKHHTHVPSLLSRHIDVYTNEGSKGRYHSKSTFNKHRQEKRFFEFSPLAFERQKFRKTGDKPFRIFDVKRFFQFSPFIARLQRSHSRIEPKLESPKPELRPFVFKPIVDHFSGFQRHTLPIETFSNPLHPWKDNQKHINDLKEETDNGFGAVVEDHIFDNTMKPNYNDKEEMNIESVSQTNNATPENMNSLHDNGLETNPLLPIEDKDNIETNQNLKNVYPETHVSDKVETDISSFLNEQHPIDVTLNSESVWQGKEQHSTSNGPNSFLSGETLITKPIGFGELAHSQTPSAFERLSDQAQTYHALGSWGDTNIKDAGIVDDAVFNQNGGFETVQPFGSFENSDILPVGAGGFAFGNALEDTQALHSSSKMHNSGVWGPFIESKFDAIPVPPLPSVVNDNEECEGVSGALCSTDSDCGCFGLYICLQNTCTSVITKEEEQLPSQNFWHEEQVDFPGFV